MGRATRKSSVGLVAAEHHPKDDTHDGEDGNRGQEAKAPTRAVLWKLLEVSLHRLALVLGHFSPQSSSSNLLTEPAKLFLRRYYPDQVQRIPDLAIESQPETQLS